MIWIMVRGMVHMSGTPLITLEQGAPAPVVRYDIPEPTTYEGKNFIELNFDEEVFAAAAVSTHRSAAVTRPAVEPRALPLSASTQDQVRVEVLRALRTGASRHAELPNRPVVARRRPAGAGPLGDTIVGPLEPMGPWPRGVGPPTRGR